MNSKIFLDNKYTKYYYQIVDRALTRKIKGENHHIIPEAFYENRTRKGPKGWLMGDPDIKENLVKLTAREHFIVHWLLIKMTEDKARGICVYALNGMKRQNKGQKRYSTPITSRVYAKLREDFGKTHSQTMSGRPAHNKNVPCSEEQKQSIRDTKAKNKTYKTCEYCGKTMVASAIKQYHGDKCEKNPNKDPNIVTVKTRGKKRTKEQVDRMVAGMTGVKKGPMKQEFKDQRSRALKGVKKSKKTVSNMKKGAQERLKNGTHPTKIRVSCIKTRKEYSLTTFIRYVINEKPGPRAKQR